jgi:hypothetical protein
MRSIYRNYGHGAEGLPLTITDGDVKGKPVLKTQYNQHERSRSAFGVAAVGFITTSSPSS